MAHIENPRKKFNFSLQIVPDPIDPFLAQKVNIPEHEIEVVEHGDANYDIKTGGRVKYGMITIEKISTTTGADTYFHDWMMSIQDTFLEGGLVPTAYKRTLTITELAEDGLTILNTWTCFGVWPSKRSAIELSRIDSDNTIEQIELCVDRIEKV